MLLQDLDIGKLYEAVRDAVVVADAHTGRIVLWNPAASKIFSYPRSEALGLFVEALILRHLRDRPGPLPADRHRALRGLRYAPRGCYGLDPSTVTARCRNRQAKATKCSPATVSGSRS